MTEQEAASVIDLERVAYSLWFSTATYGWRRWSSEFSTATKAASYREGCVARFPDAVTVVVKHVEYREALSPEREANLTWLGAS